MQIDWSKIKTVLLDMDGTLLDLHFDNYFWRTHVPHVFAQKNGITQVNAIEKLTPLFEKHAGTLEWYCVDFWSDQLGFDIMTYKREITEKIAYRPNAQAFLQQCRAEVDDVRLITNAHRKVLNLKIEHTQIDQYFDSMHCSHELDHPKEQQQFWHNLNKISSFDPTTTLFLDDSEAVLESADTFGIKHIYSIAKPDSQKERDTNSRFTMIETFLKLETNTEQDKNSPIEKSD